MLAVVSVVSLIGITANDFLSGQQVRETSFGIQKAALCGETTRGLEERQGARRSFEFDAFCSAGVPVGKFKVVRKHGQKEFVIQARR